MIRRAFTVLVDVDEEKAQGDEFELVHEVLVEAFDRTLLGGFRSDAVVRVEVFGDASEVPL